MTALKVKACAAAVILLALAAGAAQARGEDAIAVGRYHLRKANQLAGEDHCHSAIHEYTLAYQKLKDPFVLFNRGECYRRIHQSEKAIADYRAFLEAVPAAPNRTEIEAKIATMIAALSGPPAPVAAAPSVTRSPARRPEAPPSPSALPPEPPPPALPPEVRTLEEPPAVSPAVPAASPAVIVATPAPPRPEPETESHHGHTWIWIALGAAVAGGAVGAYFALRPPTTTPPATDLGNYKF